MRPLLRPTSFSKDKHILQSKPLTKRKVTSQYKSITVYCAGALFSRKIVKIEPFWRQMSHLDLKHSMSGQTSGDLMGNCNTYRFC